MASWVHKNTVRKVRNIAKKAGHDFGPFRTGDQSAIASCRNPGCKVMAEITGVDLWRFIRLGEPEESCNHEWFAVQYYREEPPMPTTLTLTDEEHADLTEIVEHYLTLTAWIGNPPQRRDESPEHVDKLLRQRTLCERIIAEHARA